MMLEKLNAVPMGLTEILSYVFYQNIVPNGTARLVADISVSESSRVFLRTIMIIYFGFKKIIKRNLDFFVGKHSASFRLRSMSTIKG